MKKITFLGLVLVLIAFTVIPVFAAGNGHGNGGNAGQNSGTGNQNKGSGIGRGRSGNQTSGQGVNGNQGNRMRTPFYLQGTIVASDTVTMTLSVSVIHGNAPVKGFIGKEIPIKASNSTMIFRITQGGEDESQGTSNAPATSVTDDETPGNRVPITFGELRKGDIVAIHGNVVGGVFQATLITVYVRAPEAGETGAHLGPFGLNAGKFGLKHGLSLKIEPVDSNQP